MKSRWTTTAMSNSRRPTTVFVSCGAGVNGDWVSQRGRAVTRRSPQSEPQHAHPIRTAVGHV